MATTMWFSIRSEMPFLDTHEEMSFPLPLLNGPHFQRLPQCFQSLVDTIDLRGVSEVHQAVYRLGLVLSRLANSAGRTR
jgi:hypothetical protein